MILAKDYLKILETKNTLKQGLATFPCHNRIYIRNCEGEARLNIIGHCDDINLDRVINYLKPFDLDYHIKAY